jgi:hypothetical protein
MKIAAERPSSLQGDLELGCKVAPDGNAIILVTVLDRGECHLHDGSDPPRFAHLQQTMCGQSSASGFPQDII